MERRRYFNQPYKDFFKTYSSKIIRIDEDTLKGYAGYIIIHEVNRPFIVGEKDNEICLADNGYSEINFLPDKENWKLCAMYDNNGNIIEWYFDITRKNSIDEEGNPYCDDLYLDIVLMPDGKTIIYDEDELQEALSNGSVSQSEYNMAYQVKNELIEKNIVDVIYLENLCKKLFLLLELEK